MGDISVVLLFTGLCFKVLFSLVPARGDVLDLIYFGTKFFELANLDLFGVVIILSRSCLKLRIINHMNYPVLLQKGVKMCIAS